MGKKKKYNARKNTVAKDAAVCTADTALPSEHSLSTASHPTETDSKNPDSYTEDEQENQKDNLSHPDADMITNQKSDFHNHDPVSRQAAEKALHPHALAMAEQRKPDQKHNEHKAKKQSKLQNEPDSS